MTDDIDREDWDARVEAVDRAFEESTDEMRRELAKKTPDDCRIAVLQVFDANAKLLKERLLATLRGEPDPTIQ